MPAHSSIGELSAALAASFDREHLAVYADALLAEGDPRGELIAIDLAGVPDALAARRVDLEKAWLARLPRGVVGSTNLGFLELRVATKAAVLALDAMPDRRLVRTLEVVTTEAVDACFAALGAGEPLQFLDELSLQDDDHRRFSHCADGIVEATPRLRHLTLWCGWVGVPHPAITSLAFRGTTVAPRTWPRVEYFQLRFRDRIDDALSAFGAFTFPRVKHLDFSTRELPDAHEVDVFQFLDRARLPQAPCEVTIPAPRTNRDLDLLKRTAQANPTLRFRTTMRYRDYPELPAGVEGPPARPWLDPDSVRADHMVIVRISDDFTDRLSLRELAAQLDSAETLTPVTLGAWQEFWDFLEDIPSIGDDELDFPTTLLLTALRGTPLETGWEDLRTMLVQLETYRRLPEVVSIRQRYG